MKVNNDILCNKYFDEAIVTLKKAITFDTSQAKSQPKKPFGEGNYQILIWIMDLAKSWGFQPKFDDENYYAYIDYGQGNDIFMIAPHLDIVPSGDLKQWKNSPFEPIIKDNILFGRGALDDKGPAIINLYALKYLKDNNYQPKNYKIRLIFGVNEEGKMDCLEKYVKQEKLPKWGYTPDGVFPCIYAEKWIVNVDIYGKTNNLFTLTGGKQYNIVNDVIYYSGPKIEQLQKLLIKNNLNCSLKDSTLKVSGKPAHGSMPELGINAATWTLHCLHLLNIEHPLITLVNDYFHNNFAAENIFGKLEDESGVLTSNLGITEIDKNGYVRIGINFRVPVLCEPQKDILLKLKEFTNKFNLETKLFNIKKAVYWPKDSYLVKTCCQSYREITNNNKQEPIAIGGGTYAKVIPNMIAFGMIDDYSNLSMHQVNEWVSLDKLKMALKVYTNAIIKFTS